jgi:hypothetical protein
MLGTNRKATKNVITYTKNLTQIDKSSWFRVGFLWRQKKFKSINVKGNFFILCGQKVLTAYNNDATSASVGTDLQVFSK